MELLGFGSDKFLLILPRYFLFLNRKIPHPIGVRKQNYLSSLK